jgi:hypothetical protein
MHKTLDAVIDEHGNVRLLEDLKIPPGRRALVIILEADAAAAEHDSALLSEQALAEDWSRPEEDAAWSHLQQPAQ